MRYEPSLSVTADREIPVSTFRAVTVTPGKVAPEFSVTRPMTVAVSAANRGVDAHAATTAEARREALMKPSSEGWNG
jgi:hypothetical protein